MTIILDPAQPETVTSYDGRRKYLIRPPKRIEEGRFRGAVAKAGAQRHGRLTILDALAEAVATPLPDDGAAESEERARLAAAVRAYREALEAAFTRWRNERTTEAKAERDRLFESPPAEVQQIEEAVRAAGSTRYSRLLGENVAYHYTAGAVALSMFCVGWEGLETQDGQPVPFRRGVIGIPPELLEHVPGDDVTSVSVRVEEMLSVPEERLGNSASESSGSLSPTSSETTSTPPPIAPSPSTISGASTSSVSNGSGSTLATS